MVDLNRKVKKCIAETKRGDAKWERLLDKAFLTEDIMENENSIDWKIRSTFWKERNGSVGQVLDSLNWIWHVKIKNILLFLSGILCTTLSVLIVSG